MTHAPHILAVLVLAACDPALSEQDSGVESVGQGSEVRSALIINEVSARPAAGPDWLEIYNRSEAAIDLCDYFVTDALDRLDHYYHLGDAPPPLECEARLLEAGAYLVVYADDDAAAGTGHAPFKLGAADGAHVVSSTGEARDSLLFLHADNYKGLSLARVPNGEGLFWPAEPTPGTANSEVSR